MADETGFLDRALRVGGELRRYAVYVPAGYSAARAWPAILFLHGRGESGRDGLRQLTQGLPQAILARREAWPALAVFPQKADPAARWADERELLEAILAQVASAWRVAPERRYLTGLSQGGHGSLALVRRLGWRFAALATVCAWSDDPAATAAALGRTPLWAFHGDADGVVPVRRSIEVVEAVTQAGGCARLTRYAGVGHDAWQAAYADEALAPWLLAQRAEDAAEPA